MSQNAPPPPKKNSRITKFLLLFTVVSLLGFLLFVAVIGYLFTRQDTGDIEDGTFAYVKLSGNIPDSPPPPELFGNPTDPKLFVTTYAEAIRAVATDDRLKGLYLKLDGPSGGWGRLQEVRSALVDLRAAGKPCVAYAEMYDNASYFLASACDKVVLAPSGITLVNGISASNTYYAETFEKIGVDPEFEHVGDFKSAIEVYERTEPSEPASEAMNYLLDGIYGNFVGAIATSRSMSVEDVRELIDRPPMSPDEALQRGLVDALAFPDAVAARVHLVAEENWEASLAEPVPKELSKDLEKRFTMLGEVAKTIKTRHASKANQIAVLHAEGPILSGRADGGLFGAEMMVADQTMRAMIREIREDDSVKAIVLRVNSPGGSGLASDMIWRELELARDEGKPIVVSMADYAASGGYYISMPADHIVAQPGTITGSIGVFGGKFNLNGAFEKLGMRQHTYKRGEQADLFSPYAGFSEGGRETYRRFLSDFYERFLQRVAVGRNMDRDTVHAVAQGRVWTGTQALERGLVDSLGGVREAAVKAAEFSKTEEGSYGLKHWPRDKELIELLLQDLQNPPGLTLDVSQVPLLAGSEAALMELLLLERMAADGAVLLLPGHLEFH